MFVPYDYVRGRKIAPVRTGHGHVYFPVAKFHGRNFEGSKLQISFKLAWNREKFEIVEEKRQTVDERKIGKFVILPTFFHPETSEKGTQC